MLNKHDSFRSRKLLDKIAELPCVRCGRQDGTIVPAHYCGPYQHRLGKGMGIKVTDAAAAALCHSCHAEMDQYIQENTTERSEEFLYLIVATHELLLKKELVNV